MLLIIFVNSSILDVWMGSEYVFGFFNETVVGHQFFTTQSWARFPGSTMLQSQSIVTFPESIVLQTRI